MENLQHLIRRYFSQLHKVTEFTKKESEELKKTINSLINQREFLKATIKDKEDKFSQLHQLPNYHDLLINRINDSCHREIDFLTNYRNQLEQLLDKLVKGCIALEQAYNRSDRNESLPNCHLAVPRLSNILKFARESAEIFTNYHLAVAKSISEITPENLKALVLPEIRLNFLLSLNLHKI